MWRASASSSSMPATIRAPEGAEPPRRCIGRWNCGTASTNVAALCRPTRSSLLSVLPIRDKGSLGKETMPSFDVVSEVDLQEVRNAVDQANREIGARFDFKGVEARFELSGALIVMHAEQEFQLQQMMDILRNKLVKRKVDVATMDVKEAVSTLNAARQEIAIKQGIDTDTAKRMVKTLKASKLKVQAQIQADQVRVSGKQRDDLQQAIAQLRAGDWGRPLQFSNFRD